MHKSFAARLYSGDEWQQDPWNRAENGILNQALLKNQYLTIFPSFTIYKGDPNSKTIITRKVSQV